MSGWDLWTCVHGVREELDYHPCTQCQEYAKKLGYDTSNRQTYIFTKEWFERKKKEERNKI